MTTPEKAATEFASRYNENGWGQGISKEAFLAGAAWQREQDAQICECAQHDATLQGSGLACANLGTICATMIREQTDGVDKDE